MCTRLRVRGKKHNRKQNIQKKFSKCDANTQIHYFCVRCNTWGNDFVSLQTTCSIIWMDFVQLKCNVDRMSKRKCGCLKIEHFFVWTIHEEKNCIINVYIQTMKNFFISSTYVTFQFPNKPKIKSNKNIFFFYNLSIFSCTPTGPIIISNELNRKDVSRP